ncbi:HNH endonuclease signature motif containing protein [Moorena sp. SIO4E2]|uniref:HNH endonuclease n=1 Tax=Moorena sp. SIO4E2 TaxID=2607826 RepID=UPI00257F640D|nr:HNH endonuclease signature motif containing protein [Moorena sp. SIO4E2]
MRSYGFEWHRASKNAGSHSDFFNPSSIHLTNSLTKQSPPFVSQSGHVKIEGSNSPDDPILKEYWLKRSLKANKTLWEKNSKYDQVARINGYKCPIFNDWLRNDEEIETHHIIPIKEGGSNLADNLVHLHKACHKLLHGKKKTKQKA